MQLNPRYQHAVQVSAALIGHDEKIIIDAFRFALKNAFEPHELVELILQSLLFDGYPCALEGLIALKRTLPEILPASEEFEPYNSANLEEWKSRGVSLCKRIYGDNFEPLLDNVGNLSPSLKEWMLNEGYGRVLARQSLPIDIREMGIIAILIVKGYPRQLHSHMRGALEVGVSLHELNEAIAICEGFTAKANISSAAEILQKLT
ncbi:hypothetical protein CEE37_08510 [candidate division LCP-89 bacterium B3_LCP]|uniref:Carboxymuconolactone decarboxylase-like domain-containing protein n=1 Tax=candidate division LCP-89 bacterium B3_LCP TaxID=2012998 RepID=A0A532UZQ3_UNCL8|nr:MAG: hypothetical protein CEE37_08510 [candidate division LCP-89 bacterium B3_LCP]